MDTNASSMHTICYCRKALKQCPKQPAVYCCSCFKLKHDGNVEYRCQAEEACLYRSITKETYIICRGCFSADHSADDSELKVEFEDADIFIWSSFVFRKIMASFSMISLENAFHMHFLNTYVLLLSEQEVSSCSDNDALRAYMLYVYKNMYTSWIGPCMVLTFDFTPYTLYICCIKAASSCLIWNKTHCLKNFLHFTMRSWTKSARRWTRRHCPWMQPSFDDTIDSSRNLLPKLTKCC